MEKQDVIDVNNTIFKNLTKFILLKDKNHLSLSNFIVYYELKTK